MRGKRRLFFILLLMITTYSLTGCAGAVDRLAVAPEGEPTPTVIAAHDPTSGAAEAPSVQPATEAPPEQAPTASPAGPKRPTAHYEPPALPVTTLTAWEGTPYEDAAADGAATLLQSSKLVVVATLIGPERIYERPDTGWGYTSFTFSVDQVLKGNLSDVLLRVLSPLTPRQFADAYNGYVDDGTLNSEMSVYTTLFPLAVGRKVLLMLQSVESPELFGGRAWMGSGLLRTVLLVGDDGSLSPSDWVDAGGSYRPDPALSSLDDVTTLLSQQLPGALPDPGDSPAGVYTGSVVYWRDSKAALLPQKELDRYSQIRTVRSFSALTAAVKADPGAAIWIDYTLAKGAKPQWFAHKPQRTLPVVLLGCYDSGYGFTQVLPIEQQFHEVGFWALYGPDEPKPVGSGFAAFRCVAETPELEDPVRIQTYTGSLSVQEILGALQNMPLSPMSEKGSDAYYIDVAAHALGLDLFSGGQLQGERSPYLLSEKSGEDGTTWTVRVIPYNTLPWIPPAMGSPQDNSVMVSILEDTRMQGAHRLMLYQVFIHPDSRVDGVDPFSMALTRQDFIELGDEELAVAQVFSQNVMDGSFPLSGSASPISAVGMNADDKDVLCLEALSTDVKPLGGGCYRVMFTRRDDVLAEPLTEEDLRRYEEKPESFSVLRTLTSTWEYELADGKAEAVRISVKTLNGLGDVEWHR